MQLSDSNSNLIRGPGHSLEIRQLSLSDLGPYTCQAYNSEGRGAASSTKVVKAMGPIDPRVLTSQLAKDKLAYVVNAPTANRPRPVPAPYDPYYQRCVLLMNERSI